MVKKRAICSSTAQMGKILECFSSFIQREGGPKHKMVNFKAILGGRNIMLYYSQSLIYVEGEKSLKAASELSKLKENEWAKRTNQKTSR